MVSIIMICSHCLICGNKNYIDLKNLEKELKKCDIVVSILAQPNVGKSTLFTRITGEISHIANFPGTTVNIRVGKTTYKGKEICFIDLPGIYGLSATTIDELIARDIIARDVSDIYLVLVDPLNLEKTLYLALQVLEITSRVIIAITKWDIAHSKGVHIHLDGIRRVLGVPIVTISGVTGEGINNLLNSIIAAVDSHAAHQSKPIEVEYGELEPYIERIESKIMNRQIDKNYTARWIAIRALEDDPLVLEYIVKNFSDVYRDVEEAKKEIKAIFGKEASEIAIEKRYRFCEEIAKTTSVKIDIYTKPSLIDRLFQHPVIGSITSMLLLFSVFITAFAINTGFPLNIILSLLGYSNLAELLQEYSITGMVSKLFEIASNTVKEILAYNTFIASFVAEGIIAGVGTVMSFLPLIFLVIFLQSALEDSGLGPRMASALHSLFTKFGLSGRAIYPLLIAIGCNVPAVLSSRSAIDEAERFEIALNISFIPCQARLIVLLAFTYVLFRGNPLFQASTIVIVYITGIILYLFMSKLSRVVLFKKKEEPELLLEIPPIHKPSIKVMMWNSWDLTKHFLYKAGVIILILSVAMWILLSYGPQGYTHGDISASYGASIGKLIAPLFSTLYRVDMETAWKLGLSLVAGFIAKEGLISSLAVMSGVEEKEAIEMLGLTSIQGIPILLLFMFYIPCIATVTAIYNEIKSLKYTLLIIVYLFTMALLISLASYIIIDMLI